MLLAAGSQSEDGSGAVFRHKWQWDRQRESRVRKAGPRTTSVDRFGAAAALH